MWAQKAGYLGDPLDPPSPESRAQWMISGSAGVTPVTLKLTPQAVIEGRATDAKGDGVALLTLWERRIDGTVAVHGTQRVDRTGAFRFAFLAPGRYYLEISSLTIGSPSGRGPLYAHGFFKEGAMLRNATPIDVEPGQTESLSVLLQAVQGHRIRGRVDCPPPDPVGAWVHVAGSDAVFDGIAVDLETRTFAMPDIPPGEYLLKGSCGTVGRQFKSLPVTVTDSDVDGLVLSFE
jgi:hypothetical protein